LPRERSEDELIMDTTCAAEFFGTIRTWS
jgi:hypothetical protein